MDPTPQGNQAAAIKADPLSPLDDRQRLAMAAQEFPKAGVGEGIERVRGLLEQEDPVAPEIPSHLLAPGVSADPLSVVSTRPSPSFQLAAMPLSSCYYIT